MFLCYIGIGVSKHLMFLFSSIWYYSCKVMSLYWVPVLTLCIFLCIRYIQLRILRFLSCSLSFYLFWIWFQGFKELYLPSIIISHILHRLFLHLVTPCDVFFANVEEVSILFRCLCCLWLLIIFVVSSISLILSLFSISSRFFIISVNSSWLFLL